MRDVLAPLRDAGRNVMQGTYVGFQALVAGMEAAAEGADEASRQTGTAEALGTEGGDFLPGTAFMALGEAVPFFPGDLPVSTVRASRLASLRSSPVKLKVPTAAEGAANALSGVGKVTTEAVSRVGRTAPVLDKTAPEAGALLTSHELTGNVRDTQKAVRERLADLPEAEIQNMAARVEAAMSSGDIVDDPHFRSLLNVDLGGKDVDPHKVFAVAEAFEDATDALFEKAGSAPRSIETMNAEVWDRLRRGVTVEDLADAAERSRQAISDTRIGVHVMALSGVQFVKARDRLLPLVRAGNANARTELTDELVKASQLYAYGRTPISNMGRALRYSQERAGLQVTEVAEGVWDLPDPGAIRAKVEDGLRNLDDDDLADLLGRIKTGADLDKVTTVLEEAEEARRFSKWRRVKASVSQAMRSNALSPATGVFNAASAVIHDFYRNDLSRSWAVRSLMKRGYVDQAEAFRLELQVGRAIYWEAHKRGINAMIDRIKWEWWSDVERVAKVGWGDGSVAKLARGKRLEMADNGYVSPALREFEGQPRAVISGSDADDFNARLNARQLQGGALVSILNAAERTGAVTLNTFDALSGASMKLFTGALDDWGRAFVELKESYMQAARFAVREGLQEAMTPAELAEYVMKRAEELAEMPNAAITDKVEEALLRGDDLAPDLRFLAQRQKSVEEEADRVLLMDGPQTTLGKSSASALTTVDPMGLVFPYVRTPIRLFERGMVDYTPWGAKSEAIRTILETGGPEAELVRAQMEIGGVVIATGVALGMAGGLILTNGDWNSTKGLDEGPPNRLQIGSTFVEIGRLDPFAVTLAIGGLIGQAIKDGFADGAEYDAEEGIRAAIQVAFLGTRDAILGKTYLTGLRDFTEMAFGRNVEGAEGRLAKMAAGVTQRLIPLAGTSRMVNDTARDSAPEAVSWADQMLRNIPGAGIYLPVRRDIFGDPVKSREFGIAIGRDDQLGGGDEPIDEVKEQIRELGLTIQDIRRADPRGFDLTAKQLDELRRIRGHEALDNEGRSLREALGELLASEEFQLTTEKAQRKMMVTSAMRAFNEPAREILAERDPKYAANREGYASFIEYMNHGHSKDEAKKFAVEDTLNLGLARPDL